MAGIYLLWSQRKVKNNRKEDLLEPLKKMHLKLPTDERV